MSAFTLLSGMLLGLSIAAPVGPIGILCIRRTVTEGRLAGFVSGLGAATADAFYGSIAAFGLTFISSALVSQQAWIRLIGGTFLCYLGVRTMLARASDSAAPVQGRGFLGAYLSVLFLTLTNPLTILSFAAIFAGLGVSARGDYGSSAVMVAGVFLGSALWWFTLSGGVGLFRSRIGTPAIKWINRISGLVLLGFGLIAVASLVI